MFMLHKYFIEDPRNLVATHKRNPYLELSRKVVLKVDSFNEVVYSGRFLSGVNYVLYNTLIGISRFDFEGSQFTKIY